MQAWFKKSATAWSSGKLCDAGLEAAWLYDILLGVNVEQERDGRLTARDVCPRHLARKLGMMIPGTDDEAAQALLGRLFEVRLIEPADDGGAVIVGWSDEWRPAVPVRERVRRHRLRKRAQSEVTAGETDGETHRVTPCNDGRVTRETRGVTTREREREIERVPPLPPQGGEGESLCDQNQTQNPEDPEDPEAASSAPGPPDDPDAWIPVDQQAAISDLLQAGGCEANLFRRRQHARQFLTNGGTLADGERLAELARKSRPGLLWHWLEDPHRWRAVLADADQGSKRIEPRAGGEPRHISEITA